MVKATNTRVMITLPKKLLKSLQNIAERQCTTVSEVIISMCERRANNLYNDVKRNCSIMNQIDLYELAKTKWLD